MHSAGDIVMDVCIIETVQAEGRCLTPSLNRATLSKSHESMCTERGTTSAVTHQTSQRPSLLLSLARLRHLQTSGWYESDWESFFNATNVRQCCIILAPEYVSAIRNIPGQRRVAGTLTTITQKSLFSQSSCTRSAEASSKDYLFKASAGQWHGQLRLAMCDGIISSLDSPHSQT